MHTALDPARTRRPSRPLIHIAASIALALLGTGAMAHRWTPIQAADAPTARTPHSAVFTRIDGTDQMIVWGGQDSGMTPFANTGGVWMRRTKDWAAMTTANAPPGRQGHT